MGIQVRGISPSHTPAGEYHPHQVWRTSSSARERATPAVWTVLAALCLVALLTAGLHLLFQ